MSTGHKFFELNYGYYPYTSHKKDIDPYLKSQLADKLLKRL